MSEYQQKRHNIIIVIVLLILLLGIAIWDILITIEPPIECHPVDYYTEQETIDKTSLTLTDIYNVNNGGNLLHKRIPKNECIPGNDQIKHIKFPTYCTFRTDKGILLEGVKFGKTLEEQYGRYEVNSSIEVETGNNCSPISSVFVSEHFGYIKFGTPKIKI
jgi:hypothetical protein